MTATEKLRALLDERGVEYESATYVLDHTGTKIEETVWQVHGVRNIYTEYPTGIKNLIIEYLEPEQAIAATLGDAAEGCYLMRDGKKFPVELDYSFLGIMPITIKVGGFRYLLEVPDGE